MNSIFANLRADASALDCSRWIGACAMLVKNAREYRTTCAQKIEGKLFSAHYMFVVARALFAFCVDHGRWVHIQWSAHLILSGGSRTFDLSIPISLVILVINSFSD